MFRSVRAKVVASFLVAIVAVVAVSSFGAYQFVHWYEHEKTDDEGASAAQACKRALEFMESDGADFRKPDDYKEYRRLLRDICRESGMDYMYAYKCDVDANQSTYLIIVAADDENDARVQQERGYGTVVDGDFSDVELQALSGAAPKAAIEYNNQFGHMLDWVCLVDGWGGDVLAAASYSVDEQRARVFRTVVGMLVPVVLALLAVLIVQLIIMWRHVFKPIHVISDCMRDFSADRADDITLPDIKSGDEMSEIADAFKGMAGDISHYVSNIETLTEERVQANVELDVARRIQLGIVPERTEVEGDGFEAVAVSRAAREVGGDFYDVLELGNGRVAVVVGDVSGKGVAAALYMAMTKTIIRDGLLVGNGPAAVLNSANTRLYESNPEGMFLTVFACVIDIVTGEVRYANAGHMPPFVVGGDVRAIEADPGVLLGLFDDVALVEGVEHLAESESLLAFTDGATEAVNAERHFLGVEAFSEGVSAGAPYESSAALADAARRIVDEFAEGCEQFDDLTIATIMRREGGVVEGLSEIAPELSSFNTIREAVFATAMEDSLKLKTCLACEETLVNVVSYSGATRMWYAVENEGAGLRVTIADDGLPFDPTAAVPQQKEFEELDSGGMGIALVRDLASDVRYRRTAACNVLTISMQPEE